MKYFRNLIKSGRGLGEEDGWVTDSEEQEVGEEEKKQSSWRLG